MLGLQIGSRPSDPVVAVFREVAVLHFLVECVLLRRLRIESSLCVHHWLLCDVHIVIRRLVSLPSQNAVDVTGGATEDVVLLGNVAGVTGQVLLLKVNVTHLKYENTVKTIIINFYFILFP